MILFLNTHHHERGWLIMTMFATILLFLAGVTTYSTYNLRYRPEDLRSAYPGDLSVDNAIMLPSQEQAASSPSVTQAPFAPFLDIVPSADGTELFISAGSAQVGGKVFANVTIGPGNRKGHTLTYSDTLQAYVTTKIDPVVGLTPSNSQTATLSISSTLGLDTGPADLIRAYIPDQTTPQVTSLDGVLQLTIVSQDTFPSDAYTVIVSSFGPPGALPGGHRLVGSSYSIRASGALTSSNQPMSLRLAYSDPTLAGADPHTLSIFSWDASNKRWDNQAGTLFSLQKFLSIATSRFTTYALVSRPAYRDEFIEFSGLDFAQFNNVTVGGVPENRTLILNTTPGNGSAVSQPITPTTAITTWGTLTYNAVIPEPTTSLTIDILSSDGTPVLSDVASGTDLADKIDAEQYPSLRLRVNMASTAGGQTPALERWELSWVIEEKKLYLPIILK